MEVSSAGRFFCSAMHSGWSCSLQKHSIWKQQGDVWPVSVQTFQSSSEYQSLTGSQQLSASTYDNSMIHL